MSPPTLPNAPSANHDLPLPATQLGSFTRPTFHQAGLTPIPTNIPLPTHFITLLDLYATRFGRAPHHVASVLRAWCADPDLRTWGIAPLREDRVLVPEEPVRHLLERGTLLRSLLPEGANPSDHYQPQGYTGEKWSQDAIDASSEFLTELAKGHRVARSRLTDPRRATVEEEEEDDRLSGETVFGTVAPDTPAPSPPPTPPPTSPDTDGLPALVSVPHSPEPPRPSTAPGRIPSNLAPVDLGGPVLDHAGPTRTGRRCYRCGQVGHLQRQCPQRQSHRPVERRRDPTADAHRYHLGLARNRERAYLSTAQRATEQWAYWRQQVIALSTQDPQRRGNSMWESGEIWGAATWTNFDQQREASRFDFQRQQEDEDDEHEWVAPDWETALATGARRWLTGEGF